MTDLHLTCEEAAPLVAALDRIIEHDRYRISYLDRESEDRLPRSNIQRWSRGRISPSRRGRISPSRRDRISRPTRRRSRCMTPKPPRESETPPEKPGKEETAAHRGACEIRAVLKSYPQRPPASAPPRHYEPPGKGRYRRRR